MAPDRRDFITYPDKYEDQKIKVQCRIYNVVGNYQLQCYVTGTYDAFYVFMKNRFDSLYENDWTAEVLEAERIEGADKLLKLTVSVGGKQRQIVAGIAKFYEPAELVGKHIVIVANLQPAKLRGNISEGMLLAASTPGHEQLAVLTVDKPLPSGSRAK